MKLLIDGDILVYRAGFATDKTKYMTSAGGTMSLFDDAKSAKEDGFSRDAVVWSRKETEPEDKALMLIDVMLGDIRAHYAAENPSLVVYLTGVGNFRNGIATRATYKGNRSGTVPPAHLKALRSHLVSKWAAVLSAGEEADDLIGIEATKSQGSSVICSIDKDLRQLPGRFYDFVNKEEVTISPKEAWLNFYSQVISGDSTDNVPGLTGYGPVKARKALEGLKNNRACWLKVLELYKAEFGTLAEAYALECAKLVYVRRSVGDIFNVPAEIKAAA
jgi:hypothetical protein